MRSSTKLSILLGMLFAFHWTTTGAEIFSGIWKPADQSYNFYIQSYDTGSTLIIASDGADGWYVFLYPEGTENTTLPELLGRNASLAIRFLSDVQASAILTVGGMPTAYDIEKTFTGDCRSAGDYEKPSVLFFAAHPDDELLIAPYLGKLCVEDRMSCTFAVLSRGESGPCRLEQGCLPDVGTVRSLELMNSARVFNAELIHWDLGNPPEESPETTLDYWAARAGDRDSLESLVAHVLRITDPELIITFDPSHGSTGHPDHRAAAMLLLDVLEDMDQMQPKVLFIETAIRGGLDHTFRGFEQAPSQGDCISFDATQQLQSIAGEAWDYESLCAAQYPSQIDEELYQAIVDTPDDGKTFYFLEYRD